MDVLVASVSGGDLRATIRGKGSMAHPVTRLNQITVVRGQTKFLDVKVKTQKGRDANLQGSDIVLTVRKRSDTEVLVSKTTPADNGIEVTDAAAGEATITLSTDDTDLEAGEYRYDVWVVSDGDPPVRQPVVQFAQMHVVDSLTDFGGT